MDCPNCKKTCEDGLAECPGCNIIFAKWFKRQQEMGGPPPPEGYSMPQPQANYGDPGNYSGGYAAPASQGYPQNYSQQGQYGQGDYGQGQYAGGSDSYSTYGSSYSEPVQIEESSGTMSLIIKVIVWGAIAGGAFAGYQHFGPDSPEVTTYKTFGEYLGRFNYKDARTISEGAALMKIETIYDPPAPQVNRNTFMGMVQHAMSASSARQMAKEMTLDMMGSVRKVKYKINSKSKEGDKAKISGIVIVHHYGTASQRGDAIRKFHLEADLIKKGDRWMVFSFNEKPVDKQQKK